MRESYKTKQQKEILNLCEQLFGKHFTVSDLFEKLKEEGKNIGTTTIYRHLNKFVEEGVVKKYVIDEKSPACFEYIGENATNNETSIHLKCEKCNKLIHIKESIIKEFKKKLFENHNFNLDVVRTTFYGQCELCR